jgi:hypothetical protein
MDLTQLITPYIPMIQQLMSSSLQGVDVDQIKQTILSGSKDEIMALLDNPMINIPLTLILRVFDWDLFLGLCQGGSPPDKCIHPDDCNKEDEPVCDKEHLNLCDGTETCQEMGGYWYNDTCHKEPKVEEPDCTEENRAECYGEDECAEVGGYWYNGECHDTEEEEKPDIDITPAPYGGMYLGRDIPAHLIKGLIIDPRSLSHSKIMEDLKRDALARPDGMRWKDWLDSSTGTIILRWIAAVATYDVFKKIVNRYENSLEFARHTSSIYEHAFNRGFCASPTGCAIIEITYNNPSIVQHTIVQDQHIGYMGEYGVYSLETVSFSGLQKVKACVGFLNEFVKDFAPLAKFTELSFECPHQYIGAEMERMTADGEEQFLYSDLNYLKNIENSMILRRIIPNTSISYIGNGTTGWWKKDVQQIKYRCLSYNDDMDKAVTGSITSLVDPAITTIKVISPATYALSDEELRGTAIYYPLDGRIVTAQDYEVSIMKWFGGVLCDVFSYNSDPHEEICLLADDNYTEGNLAQVKELVDSKRGLGISNHYYVFTKDMGKDYFPKFKIHANVFSEELYYQINDWLKKMTFKFARLRTTLDATVLAIRLTNEFNVDIYPNTEEFVNLEPYEFLKNLQASIGTFTYMGEEVK